MRRRTRFRVKLPRATKDKLRRLQRAVRCRRPSPHRRPASPARQDRPAQVRDSPHPAGLARRLLPSGFMLGIVVPGLSIVPDMWSSAVTYIWLAGWVIALAGVWSVLKKK
jgi:hypothetical protein